MTDTVIPNDDNGFKPVGTKMLRRGDVISVVSRLISEAHEEREDLYGQGLGGTNRSQKLGQRLASLYDIKADLARLPAFISADHAPADHIPLGAELNERALLAVRDSESPPEALKAVTRFIGDIRIPIEELREFVFEDDEDP